MSGFKDLGAKPKEYKKSKRWSILQTSKKQPPQVKSPEENTPDKHYANSIKKEINRLEDANKRYENDYFHERKMLLFSVYEQQFLLDTKTNYWRSQEKLISAIKAENSNIIATINMYNNRIKVNNEHVFTLEEGAKSMETYSHKLKEDIAATIKKIDNLDNYRKDAVKNNTELRIKYLGLLNNNLEKDNRGAHAEHPDGCKPIMDIVKELESCLICYNKMTPKVYSCRQSHSLCAKCYEKIGDRCPFCSINGPLTRNRVVENLLKAATESDGKKKEEANNKEEIYIYI